MAKTWGLRRMSGLRHRLWWTRAVTLGVRALVVGDRGLFLVRHTYLPGWFLPGGAVDRGESVEGAIVRELREEGGIVCRQRPQLHGVYRSAAAGGRDHVACFVVTRFDIEETSTDWEIAERGFFEIGDLPPDTSRATHSRVAEVFHGQSVTEDW